MLLGPLKNSASDRARLVGISRYKVFYLTPPELGDIGAEKKKFFFSGSVNTGQETFKEGQPDSRGKF